MNTLISEHSSKVLLAQGGRHWTSQGGVSQGFNSTKGIKLLFIIIYLLILKILLKSWDLIFNPTSVNNEMGERFDLSFFHQCQGTFEMWMGYQKLMSFLRPKRSNGTIHKQVNRLQIPRYFFTLDWIIDHHNCNRKLNTKLILKPILYHQLRKVTNMFIFITLYTPFLDIFVCLKKDWTRTHHRTTKFHEMHNITLLCWLR